MNATDITRPCSPSMSPPPSSSPLSSILSSPPSSPLTVLSRSPSPPLLHSSPSPMTNAALRYPSPSSTMSSGSASPCRPSNTSSQQDGPPPAKKRKITIFKERKTRYLDLEDDQGLDSEALLEQLETVLRRKKRIVVVAGAGISVSAGIPDFRSSEGLFRTLQDKHKIKGGGKQLFDASVYRDDKSTAEFHKMVRDLSRLTKDAEPTPFHHMLATIAQEGRLMRLYSQNVDCIDTSLKPLATTIPLNIKGPWPTTIQLHGGLQKMQCTKCSNIEDFEAELFQGPEPPCCKKCTEADHVRTSFAGKRSHGIGRLRPRMVLYHEYNPDEDAIGAVAHADLRRTPDAVIVVGTSLKVPGVRRIVKEMCQATRSRRDGFTAWLNLDPEPQGADVKDLWDVVVRGKSDDIATRVALPRWDADETDIGTARSWALDSPEKQAKREQNLERSGRLDVVVPDAGQQSTLKLLSASSALLTPSASPRQQSPVPAKEMKKTVGKQSKLNFGSEAGKENVPVSKSDTKPRKSVKYVKKSVKDSKKPSNNTINKTFKTTKASTAPKADVKEPVKKLGEDKNKSSGSAVGVEFSLPTVSLTQQTKRPSAFRAVNSVDDKETNKTAIVEQQLVDSKPETVSPTSKPQGMGHLLD